MILTDARDLDPGERKAVEASQLIHLKRIEDLLEHSLPTGPLWIHFDVDVIDPQELRAVAYPAAGGPSSDELRPVFKHLAGTGRVEAISVSTWDPLQDADGSSRKLTMGLVDDLLIS